MPDPSRSSADSERAVCVQEAKGRSPHSPADVGRPSHEHSPSASLDDIRAGNSATQPELEGTGDVSTRTTGTAEASPEISVVVSQTPPSSPRLQRPNLTIVTDVLHPEEGGSPGEVKQTPTSELHVHFHEDRSDGIAQVPRTPVTESRPNPSPVSTSSHRSSSTSNSSRGKKSVIQGHWTDAFVAPPVDLPPQIRPERTRKLKPRRRSTSGSSKGSHHSRASSSTLNEPPHWSHNLTNYVPVPAPRHRSVYTPVNPTPPTLPEFRPPGLEFQVPDNWELFLMYRRGITLPPIHRLPPIDSGLIAEEDGVSVHRSSEDDQASDEQIQGTSEAFGPRWDSPVTGLPAGTIGDRFSGVNQAPAENAPAQPEPIDPLDIPITVPPAGLESIDEAHNQSSFDISTTDGQPPVVTNRAQSPSSSTPRRAFHLRDFLLRRGKSGAHHPVKVSWGWAEPPVFVAPPGHIDHKILPPDGHELLPSDTNSECGTITTIATTGEPCCAVGRC
ncbi:hypothetical protein F5I97DRAFT_2028259 [Phlebopus sp. FC_14]|nr:hypothetical protein F5I97DRAFT_2028259 [Phlebopus sp. FC_14]